MQQNSSNLQSSQNNQGSNQGSRTTAYRHSNTMNASSNNARPNFSAAAAAG